MSEITCPRCKGAGKVVLGPGLGPIFRYARDGRNESLRQVVKATGVSLAHLSALENNETRNPTLKTLMLLAGHYDMAIEELARAMKEQTNDG